MERYADGDDRAFATVFEVIGPRLLRYLRRLCGSDEAARDLLQEALLRLHQARGAFREGSAVLPWSYTIARNVFLDSARAKTRAGATFAARDPETVADRRHVLYRLRRSEWRSRLGVPSA